MTVILVSPVPDVAGTALAATLAAGFGEVPVARDAADARDAARACPRPVLVVDLLVLVVRLLRRLRRRRDEPDGPDDGLFIDLTGTEPLVTAGV